MKFRTQTTTNRIGWMKIVRFFLILVLPLLMFFVAGL